MLALLLWTRFEKMVLAVVSLSLTARWGADGATTSSKGFLLGGGETVESKSL